MQTGAHNLKTSRAVYKLPGTPASRDEGYLVSGSPLSLSSRHLP
jgi:hypothetical protein